MLRNIKLLFMLLLIVPFPSFSQQTHEPIFVEPIKKEIKIVYRSEYEFETGNSYIIFSEVYNYKITDIVRLLYSGSTYVKIINEGNEIYFLRYQNDDNYEHELWRYDKTVGRIEYVTNTTGLYDISENGKILAYSKSKSKDKPMTDIVFFNMVDGKVINVIDGDKKVNDRYKELDKYEYFQAYVKYNNIDEAFIVTMDDWNEGGPKTFYYVVSITELENK